MIKIFIESEHSQTSECRFVDTMAELLLSQGSYDIVTVGGKDKLRNKVNINMLKKNSLEGGLNLVIFDADGVENGGGYEVRRNELNALKSQYGVDFDLFLFPNNHDDGDFETLLEQCVNEEHQSILRCFSNFEACVKAHEGNHKYYTPNRKDRMFTYGQIVGGNKDMWNFQNKSVWNLNNSYIQPLCKFLSDKNGLH